MTTTTAAPPFDVLGLHVTVAHHGQPFLIGTVDYVTQTGIGVTGTKPDGTPASSSLAWGQPGRTFTFRDPQ